MDNNKKLMIAKVLENTNRFMTEAFENSTGTQRADLGAYKKFCLTLNTLALPNLITSDLVITYPMSSISGSITFLRYVAGSNKSNVKGNKERQEPTLFNGVYSLGEMTPSRMNYTGERVVEFANEVDEESWYQLSWTPVREAQAWNGSEWVECAVTLDGKVQVPAGTKIRYV